MLMELKTIFLPLKKEKFLMDNNNLDEIDEDKINLIISRIVALEITNLKSEDKKYESDIVKEIKKIIEEEVDCY